MATLLERDFADFNKDKFLAEYEKRRRFIVEGIEYELD